MYKRWLVATACSGFLAVAFGAFGAHGLKQHLTPDEMEWFETANRYHFYHTLAMFCVVSLPVNVEKLWLTYSLIAFMVGILLFSGSLYLMAVTGWKFLGPVTPMGGLSFLAGWALLVVGLMKKIHHS